MLCVTFRLVLLKNFHWDFVESAITIFLSYLTFVCHIARYWENMLAFTEECCFWSFPEWMIEILQLFYHVFDGSALKRPMRRCGILAGPNFDEPLPRPSWTPNLMVSPQRVTSTHTYIHTGVALSSHSANLQWRWSLLQILLCQYCEQLLLLSRMMTIIELLCAIACSTGLPFG